MKYRHTVPGTMQLKNYATRDLLRRLCQLCSAEVYTPVSYRAMARWFDLPYTWLNTGQSREPNNTDTIITLYNALRVLERCGYLSVKPITHDTVGVRLRPPVTGRPADKSETMGAAS